MIYTYDGTNASINLNPNNAGEVIWYLKQTLKQAGWTVTMSGDGTSGSSSGTNYSTTGDIFTAISSAKTGSGGMCNAGAWFVIRQPASTRGAQRQIMFKVGASSSAWNVYYSYTSGFSGSITTGATVPSASDSVTINSAGYIFAGAFASGAVSNTYRVNMGADNAAPYGFWCTWFPYGTTGTTVTGALVFDPLLDGTYDSNDADPYVFYFPYNSVTPASLPTGIFTNATGYGVGVETTGGVMSLYKDKTASITTALTNTPGLYIVTGATTAVPAGMVANVYSNKDEIFPIMYARRSALSTQVGFKGMGTLMKWCGTQRNTGDTLSVASSGAKDRIVMGQISLPWNGTTPLI